MSPPKYLIEVNDGKWLYTTNEKIAKAFENYLILIQEKYSYKDGIFHHPYKFQKNIFKSVCKFYIASKSHPNEHWRDAVDTWEEFLNIIEDTNESI